MTSKIICESFFLGFVGECFTGKVGAVCHDEEIGFFLVVPKLFIFFCQQLDASVGFVSEDVRPFLKDRGVCIVSFGALAEVDATSQSDAQDEKGERLLRGNAPRFRRRFHAVLSVYFQEPRGKKE